MLLLLGVYDGNREIGRHLNFQYIQSNDADTCYTPTAHTLAVGRASWWLKVLHGHRPACYSNQALEYDQ